MSPEQARGQRVTPASDVFSCGIIFYELFTGEHPFRAATPLDTLTAILNSEPPPVSSRSAAVPEQISNVIARALRKEAAERFPSAEELRAQLQQARAAASTAPAEVAPPRRKPRWMQAIGAVLMAALLAAGTWLFRSSSRAPGGALAVESMAVMNFRAEEEDARTAVLARGLAEDLNAALARTGFRVAPGSSVAALGSGVEARMAGAQLGVDAVMEGTVHSYGNRLKVHIELVSTRTGFQVWSGSFAVDAEDLLTSEQKAAAQIAEEIRAGLGARGP
jgi:TolB-like protein